MSWYFRESTGCRGSHNSASTAVERVIMKRLTHIISQSKSEIAVEERHMGVRRDVDVDVLHSSRCGSTRPRGYILRREIKIEKTRNIIAK
jgi:hypothetical protein